MGEGEVSCGWAVNVLLRLTPYREIIATLLTTLSVIIERYRQHREGMRWQSCWWLIRLVFLGNVVGYVGKVPYNGDKKVGIWIFAIRVVELRLLLAKWSN